MTRPAIHPVKPRTRKSRVDPSDTQFIGVKVRGRDKQVLMEFSEAWGMKMSEVLRKVIHDFVSIQDAKR
jgi:hypothetical protein